MSLQAHLLELEADIMGVSDRGAEFQGRVGSNQKTDTGDAAADVVTAADYWVQLELLKLLVETPLQQCQLVAEESSAELAPVQARFAASSDVCLYIDPIDGTQRFVEGTPYFSTIVSLRRGDSCLYTFCYFPKLKWWVRMVGEQGFSQSGPFPIALEPHPETVVYTAGSAEDFVELGARLPGYNWSKGSRLHPCGSKLLYLGGAVAGYACANPNPYDGLLIYHFAQVRRHSIHTLGLCLDELKPSPRGLRLGGQYLCHQVLRP